jgi:hypothetical protein
MGGACSTYGGEKYIWFWWENLRERDLGIPRLRWEDNIKMGLQ